MVMFGTKWPSITSTWIQSAPAASIARISSPSLEKSDARIDGAIKSGRIKASGRGSSNTRKPVEQRAALTSPQPPRQWVEHEWQKVRSETARDRGRVSRVLASPSVFSEQTFGLKLLAGFAAIWH